MRLLLIPGLDGTGDLFDDLIAELRPGNDIEVLRYPTDKQLTPVELLDLLKCAVPTSESFVIVAESFSTPIAIRHAGTNPVNLAGLVLCAGFTRSPVRNAILKWFLKSCMPLVFRLPLPDFAVRKWLVGAKAPDALVQLVRETIERVKPDVLSQRLGMVLSCDSRAELKRTAAPILYLRAGHDRLVGNWNLSEIQRINSAVSARVLDGPHLILQSEAPQCAKIIQQFLNMLAAEQSPKTRQPWGFS